MENIEIVTVSFRLHKEDVTPFEEWFRFNYDVINISNFQDTPRMYKEDKHYKELIKQKKILTKSIELYRNKNNHKYLDNGN